MKLNPKEVKKWIRWYQNMRRKITKKKLIIFGALFFGWLLYTCLHKWKILCSNSNIQSTIDTMCQHFNGKAHGNLCRSFCVSNSLIPQNCQTFHVGKEVVFSANFDDLPVFVKGRRLDFMSHPEEALHWSNHVFPSPNDFQLMVLSYLRNNMGLNLPENTNLMEKLWFTEDLAIKDVHIDTQNWQRASLWTLIQDNEYVLSRLYASTDVFPSIFGSFFSFLKKKFSNYFF